MWRVKDESLDYKIRTNKRDYRSRRGAYKLRICKYFKSGGLSLPTHWVYKGDWHSDKQSAIKKAEEMRQKKIESLKRQIKKLEEMRFE